MMIRLLTPGGWLDPGLPRVSRVPDLTQARAKPS
jgi:hypothetical protein